MRQRAITWSRPPEQQRVADLLKRAGIDPMDVPRFDGIFIDGYRTVNRPIVFINGEEIATTWHDWDCSPELARAIWDAYIDFEYAGIVPTKETDQ